MSTPEKTKIEWLQLYRTPGIGVHTFNALMRRFGTAQKAIEALPEYSRNKGKKTITPFSFHDAEHEYEILLGRGGGLLIASDDDYPFALKHIADAPPVISYEGQLDILKRPCVAIVGARNASMNGKRFAQKMATDLGQNNITVVSGLARGIDRYAHLGGLETGTVGVVAGGLDVVYPHENKDLYDQMRKTGLILSENPLGAQPKAQDFPRRNRIVSGLSAGVVVVEAALKSGSLITARLAAEQGRDVFAVPGSPLDPRSAGANKLIRDGAILIENVDQILEHIATFTPKEHTPTTKEPAFNFDTEDTNEKQPRVIVQEKAAAASIHDKILNELSADPIAVDIIIRRLNLTSQDALGALMDLELSGDIHRHAGNMISRAY